MKLLQRFFQKRINVMPMHFAIHFAIHSALCCCALIFNAASAAVPDFHWETPPSLTQGSERPGNQALLVLAGILTAFESADIGSVAKIEASIEPAMVGLSQLLRAIQDAQAQQQSIRIHLSDIKVNASANAKANMDTVIITGRWEKRYLAIAIRALPPATQPQTPSTATAAQLPLHSLVPYLIKGDVTFVFQCSKKQCKLSGMTGANLFAGGL